MKKYIAGAVFVSVLLFTPLVMVQAGINTEDGISGDMTEVMESMMGDEMTFEKKMEFSNKLKSRTGYSHFGKFGSKANLSGTAKVLLFSVYTLKAFFGLLILSLLVMTNILLYRKLQGKKRR